MTYAELGIPYARQLWRGYNKTEREFLKAHAREMAHAGAEVRNWGWVISETGIASKTNKKILETSLRDGAIIHKWSKYDKL